MSSTIKIKAPPDLPMPEMGYLGDDASYGYDYSDMAFQLAARDAQWQEMVGPVVEALKRISDYSLPQFRSAAEMAAHCVVDAAGALSAITEEAPQQLRPSSQLARRMPPIDHDDPWLSGDDMMGSSG